MGIDFEYIWTDKKRTLFGLPLSFTRYILTEKKFVIRTGFLNVHESEFDLYRVIDKSLDLPLGQRMFGCGSVNITVRDADTPTVIVKSVKEPRKFMEIFEQQVDIQRDKYNTRGRDMIAPEPPMPPEDD